MAFELSVGNARVFAISDKSHHADREWCYPEVPNDAWLPYRDLLTPDGMIALNFGCYLVQADEKNILIDTGWGPTMAPPGDPAGNGKLLDELTALGVGVDDIDAVVFTHLHADHVGWNLTYEGDVPHARFTRARYLVPDADWQFYSKREENHPNIREQALPLESLGIMDLIGDGFRVTPSLVTVATPGHTPGHHSMMLTSGSEQLFILGDLVHTPIVAQETTWTHRFDVDRTASVAKREEILDRVERDQQLVAISHFPHPGIGRFERRDGRRQWFPVSRR